MTYQHTRKVLLGSAAAAMSLLALSLPALAQPQSIEDILREDSRTEPPRNTSGRIPYSLRVSPQVTYSDNVDLSPDNEQADGLASVVFEGGVLLNRVNFNGFVNGRIEGRQLL